MDRQPLVLTCGADAWSTPARASRSGQWRADLRSTCPSRCSYSRRRLSIDTGYRVTSCMPTFGSCQHRAIGCLAERRLPNAGHCAYMSIQATDSTACCVVPYKAASVATADSQIRSLTIPATTVGFAILDEAIEQFWVVLLGRSCLASLHTCMHKCQWRYPSNSSLPT